MVKKWLQFELKRWYGQKNTASRLLMMTHLRLANALTVDYVNKIDAECSQTRRAIIARKKLKINKLTEQQRPKPTTSAPPLSSFHPRITNLTNVSFEQAETKLLEKGLQYAVPPLNAKAARTNLMADLVVALEKETDVTIATKCAEIIRNDPIDEVPRTTSRTLRSIKEKIRTNDLIISKADKGNSVVIMSRTDYDNKMREFINANGGERVSFDFVKFNSSVRQCIKMSEFVIDDHQKRSLVIMNPVPPRLYGLPKIHKNNAPLRPIVSYISSPTYKLCKFLDKWLKNNTNFCSSYAVKNTRELIDRLQNFDDNNPDFNNPDSNNLDVIHPDDPGPSNPPSILVSFDVSSLYTNVPITPTLDCVREILEQSLIYPAAAEEFIALLQTCLKNNVCKYTNEFFKFPDGLPMGSPIAPLMAEIFMNSLEKDIFTSASPLVQKIQYWYRYVDDILCLWKGSTDQLTDFLKYINDLYPSIKFTLEVGGSSINFLDLTISLKNGRHTFEIFRKPTHTDIVISGSSFHPPAHRHAAFLAMIHRLISVPLSPPSFKKEVAIIKHLASVNEVQINIDDLIRKKRISYLLDSTTSHPRTYYSNFASRSRYLIT
jgi:hypothetical protein